jgi:hypothetical protein
MRLVLFLLALFAVVRSICYFDARFPGRLAQFGIVFRPLGEQLRDMATGLAVITVWFVVASAIVLLGAVLTITQFIIVLCAIVVCVVVWVRT